jgi:hypothetical protein
MMDNLLRDLRILHKADFLVSRIWLNILVRRLGYFSVAALIAVFGLAMANVAAVYALHATVGPVWAAAIVAVADLVIATVILLIGHNSRPGPEIDLAFEVRKMAIESIQADSRDLKLRVEAFARELQSARATIAGFVQSPLDAAAQKLLVPAALSILRGLRSKKDHAT